MKNLLIISYSFPPSNDPAVHRIVKFAKHLPKFGWNPIILTALNGIHFREDSTNGWMEKYFSKIYKNEGKFDRPIKNILRSAKDKSLIRYLIKNLALPDQYFSWQNSAIQKGIEIIKNNEIHAIFATVNPYTSGLIASKLHQKTGIPFIIDYRDPWTLSKFHYTNVFKHFFNRFLEKGMLRNASSIIVTSKPMKNLYVEHDYFDEDNIYVITNSIDEEFQKFSAAELLDKTKINLSYSGSFYNDRQPYEFLMALAKVMEKNPDYSEQLHVNLIGARLDGKAVKIINEHNLKDNISVIPSVEYATSLNYLANSDVLLLLNGKAEHNNIFIPAKLFDYLAVEKPILFIGKGQPMEIIKTCQIGESATHDIPDIATQLDKILTTKYSPQNTEQFHASKTTEQLAQILEAIC